MVNRDRLHDIFYSIWLDPNKDGSDLMLFYDNMTRDHMEEVVKNMLSNERSIIVTITERKIL